MQIAELEPDTHKEPTPFEKAPTQLQEFILETFNSMPPAHY